MNTKSHLTLGHLLAVLIIGASLVYIECVNSGSGFALVGLAMIAVVYFIPTITAERRHKRNAAAIAVLNVFLGWTFIGWVVALVWACTEDS